MNNLFESLYHYCFKFACLGKMSRSGGIDLVQVNQMNNDSQETIKQTGVGSFKATEINGGTKLRRNSSTYVQFIVDSNEKETSKASEKTGFVH